MIRFRRKAVLVLGVVVGVCALGWGLRSWFGRPRYEVVYLPVGGEFSICAVAVNDLGQVAGDVEHGDDRWKGFLWDLENGITEFAGEDGDRISVCGINDAGQIVGGLGSKGGDGETVWRPFIWDEKRGVRELDVGNEEEGQAVAINNKGDVVGTVYSGFHDPNNAETSVMCIWDAAERMKTVDEVKGRIVWVSGINDRGEVAGSVGDWGEFRGFLWSESRGLRHPVPKDSISYVVDIDSAGNVLCVERGSEDSRFLWNDGKAGREFGTFGCDYVVSSKMNDRGDIVGVGNYEALVLLWGIELGEDRVRAFLRKANGTMVRIDRLFGKDCVFYPADINNEGWIVGHVDEESSGQSRAVLLRPE